MISRKTETQYFKNRLSEVFRKNLCEITHKRTRSFDENLFLGENNCREMAINAKQSAPKAKTCLSD